MVSMIRKEPATPGLYYFERTRNPWSLLLRKSPHPLVSMIMKEPATPGIYYCEPAPAYDDDDVAECHGEEPGRLHHCLHAVRGL